MPDVREHAEREIGIISDAEYENALQYAECKLQSINERYGTNHGDRYLALLVAKTVQADRLTEFTRRLWAKEKGANTTQQRQPPYTHYSTREPDCQEILF